MKLVFGGKFFLEGDYFLSVEEKIKQNENEPPQYHMETT